MTQETQDRDCETRQELLDRMNALIGQGYATLVKWTCPACGDRVTSGVPNTFSTAGYYHDKPGCGALYTGDRYGLLAIYVSDKEMLAKLLATADQSMPGFKGPLPGFRD